MIDRFSWIAIYPEIVLLVMACVIALVDLLDKSQRRMPAYILSVLTLLGVAALTGMYASGGQTIYGFNGLVVSDPMANWLKCFAALAVLVGFVYGRTYVLERGMLRGAGLRGGQGEARIHQPQYGAGNGACIHGLHRRQGGGQRCDGARAR